MAEELSKRSLGRRRRRAIQEFFDQTERFWKPIGRDTADRVGDRHPVNRPASRGRTSEIKLPKHRQ